MCPNPAFPACHWDGSPRTTHPRRPLRVAATSPSRLLRAGQSGHCRQCGNRIDIYQRADQRPIALHPTELATAHVPPSSRWHLSGGIAHPHGDGSDWCRIPHTLLCPHRTTTRPLTPHVAAARRQLAVRARRLIDAGSLAPTVPAPVPASNFSSNSAYPARPVVQLLLGRYLADQQVPDIRCVAQTRHRHHCPQPVLAPYTPQGIWTLLPASPRRGQLALPTGLMAIYDLNHLPYAEQLRWRTQRCPAHATAPGAADLTLAGWEVFDPLLHAAHICTCLPAPTSRSQEE
ncbi:DUF6083 domain-containing protein [Streptomyces mirabilis]|uniref:DUF6083 domain-containing protein n=1 Tax=Streptomyces mirabilis TaxID=68239 RepID=UPI0021BE8D76|nr:DUF6083 domain-containing protein [Streptomyces mirabilis]MCT9113308.1 DUF6083 domain-containing protein [Streptomyces mirabilis]